MTGKTGAGMLVFLDILKNQILVLLEAIVKSMPRTLINKAFSFLKKSLEMKGERKVSKRMTLGLALALGLKTYMSEREDEKFNFIGFVQYRLLPKTFGESSV